MTSSTSTADAGEPEVVVVTGANGDIGRATRRVLAAAGFRTVGIDLPTTSRHAPRAPATLPHDDVHAADLTDEPRTRALLARITQEHGPLFGLVSCAGVYEALDARTTTLDDLERVWRGNVVTAWVAAQAFAEHAKDGARIVNLASISGQHGSPDVAYGTAKGGVIALTKSLALHLAPRIRVNAVAPGVVEGTMAARIPAARLESYRTSNLLGRLGRPDEIAHAVLALLGPAGAWTTGTIIDINGGLA